MVPDMLAPPPRIAQVARTNVEDFDYVGLRHPQHPRPRSRTSAKASAVEVHPA